MLSLCVWMMLMWLFCLRALRRHGRCWNEFRAMEACIAYYIWSYNMQHYVNIHILICVTYICIYIYIYMNIYIYIYVHLGWPRRGRRRPPQTSWVPGSRAITVKLTYVYMCTSLSLYLSLSLDMCMYIYIYIYTSLSLYIHTYIYIHTHVYIHTYIHVYILCCFVTLARGWGRGEGVG